MGPNNVGSIEYNARIETSQLRKDAAEADSIVKNTGSNMGSEMEKGESRGSAALEKLAKVAKYAAITIGTAVGISIVKNLDDAVKRIDTLNNFPRVLTAMGATAQDAKNATDKLSKSLEGLPTTLQDGASGVQSLVAAGLTVPRATDTFLALNNALLAAGSGADDTQIVMQSLTRAISAGTVDATTMQAALSRMPTVLQALSKETGKSAGELFKLYSSDPQKLIDDMVRLNKSGSGAMKSLEKQARDATGGIETGWDNMNTAITRGIASIMNSIGPESISGGLATFGKSMEGTLKGISDFVPKIKELVREIAEYLGPKLGALGTTIRDDVLPAISNFAKAFGPALGAGLVGVIGLAVDGLNILLSVLSPVISFLSDNTYIVWGMVAAFVAFKAALVIQAAVEGFTTGLAVMRGATVVTAGTMATTTGVAGGLRLAFMALLGPWQIVLAIAGVAAVVAGIKAIKGALDEVSNGIDNLNKKQVTIGSNPSGPKVSGGSNIGLTQQIMNAFSGFRAGGGPVSAGKAYVVGENQPELFVPRTSGTIIPEIPNQRGNKIENHIGNIYIASEVDADRVIRRLTGDQEIVSHGLVPTQRYA